MALSFSGLAAEASHAARDPATALRALTRPQYIVVRAKAGTHFSTANDVLRLYAGEPAARHFVCRRDVRSRATHLGTQEQSCSGLYIKIRSRPSRLVRGAPRLGIRNPPRKADQGMETGVENSVDRGRQPAVDRSLL